MSHPFFRRTLLVALLGILLQAGPLRGDDDQRAADLQTLQQAGVPTDGPGLLAFFASRTATADDEPRIARTITQLGDRSFHVRERALRSLIAEGPKAVRQARAATTHPDSEMARRARVCVERIESGPGPELPAAAVRLLAECKPAGADAALLAYLPFAADSYVEEVVIDALARLVPPTTDPSRAIRDAARGRDALCRAAAGHVLGQSKAAALRGDARLLLSDPDSRVRWWTARGLLRARDRAAVPALIGLIGSEPSELAVRAEEYLYYLAGDKPPAFPPPASDTRKVWAAWWREQGDQIDLDRIADAPASRHLTLICSMSLNRVWEVDRAGKTRWSIAGLNGPIDATVLPGNRVLIVEHGGRLVSERDFQGKIVWKKTLPFMPVSCQRLPNGRYFVTTYGSLHEFDRTGKELSSHTVGNHELYAGRKLRDGRILAITRTGMLRLYDGTTGKLLSSHQLPVSDTYCVEQLPNGHYLTCNCGGNGHVYEFDRTHKLVWKVPVSTPYHATRLANGNTLVSCYDQHKVMELNRAGKVVWEVPVGNSVWRVWRR